MQAEDNERRDRNLEEAKKIIIENDSSLPCPETVSHHHIYVIIANGNALLFFFFVLNNFMFYFQLI